MAVVKDWAEEAARKVARHVLPDGDRSDVEKIRRILVEHSPVQIVYEKVPARTELSLIEGIAIQTKVGKDTITLLPAIPGHSHVIGGDGQPKCGCQYLRPARLSEPMGVKILNG